MNGSVITYGLFSCGSWLMCGLSLGHWYALGWFMLALLGGYKSGKAYR